MLAAYCLIITNDGRTFTQDTSMMTTLNSLVRTFNTCNCQWNSIYTIHTHACTQHIHTLAVQIFSICKFTNAMSQS